MTANEFANEFFNDFIEELNNKISQESYGFDKNVLSDDPDLKILKSKLIKLGFVLEKSKDNLYKIHFSKETLLDNMCEYVDNHIFPAKDYLLNNCKNESANDKILSLINESYKSCRNQIINDIKKLV